MSRRRNLVLAALLVGLVAAMGGLAFASAPLYRLFCQATGYGGTTQRAEVAPALDRAHLITVRFNADVAADLNWTFQPVEREMTLRLGETATAYYRARNNSSTPVTGRAVFNVTPEEAGAYFNKIDCFCFQEQTLQPGESVDMAVEFFVDPAMLQDRASAGIGAVTLSYTFFAAADEPAAVSDAATAPAGAVAN
jgi:cytochrome c oxidase assembly protein subunit 11